MDHDGSGDRSERVRVDDGKAEGFGNVVHSVSFADGGVNVEGQGVFLVSFASRS